MQAQTNPFTVSHAIGDTWQVVRIQREPISGRRSVVVVSTHVGQGAAEQECERWNGRYGADD